VSEKKIKVTDKRLFTADGELRNGYRDLDDESPPESPRVDETAADPGEAAVPPASRGYNPPTFIDLVGVVAQPIALYLGDARMPNEESLENLELARLYIDLLEILNQKSEGNLTPDEKGFLDDLLYQLRLRYVEKSG